MNSWQPIESIPIPDSKSEAARRMAAACEVAVDHPRLKRLYLPIYGWIRDRLGDQTLIVGLNAPQGAGKTTLTGVLRRAFEADGIRTAVVSIDDFYLPREEQVALSRAHPDNPYLQARGYPGTHDVVLGTDTLQRLRALAAGERLALPAYDKSAHGGRGDRIAKDDWPVVQGPVRLVIVEGWMLGFEPVEEIKDPLLAFSNEKLASYFAWTSELDAFIFLEPENIEFVLSWRVEAEKKMREARGSGMTDEEAAAYIATFLPAYETWLHPLKRSPPVRKPALRARIRADRLPAPLGVEQSTETWNMIKWVWNKIVEHID